MTANNTSRAMIAVIITDTSAPASSSATVTTTPIPVMLPASSAREAALMPTDDSLGT